METVGDIIQSMQGELQNYEDEVPFSLFAEYAERLRRANRGSWLMPNDESVRIVSNLENPDIDDEMHICIYEDDGDLEVSIGERYYRKKVFLDRDRAMALRGILDAYLAGRFEQHIKEIA